MLFFATLSYLLMIKMCHYIFRMQLDFQTYLMMYPEFTRGESEPESRVLSRINGIEISPQ